MGMAEEASAYAGFCASSLKTSVWPRLNRVDRQTSMRFRSGARSSAEGFFLG